MFEYLVDDKARDMIRLAVGLYKYSDEVDSFFEPSLYWATISSDARAYLILDVCGSDWQAFEKCSDSLVRIVSCVF